MPGASKPERIRGSVERRLVQPEKAGIDLFGNAQVILPGARVRAARASATTVFAGGLAAGADHGEEEEGREPEAEEIKAGLLGLDPGLKHHGERRHHGELRALAPHGCH